MNRDKEIEAITVYPVGVVRSPCKVPVLRFEDGALEMGPPGDSGEQPGDETCDLVVFDEYADCLQGLEDFSHVIVIYWSHLAGDGAREARLVHPAGQRDVPLVGVFATRSPARPNPVCVTTARLLEREGNVLKLKGLDAVDGSPVIDIKPHHPRFDAPADVKLAGWMEQLMRRMGPGPER